ncbi:hypothetical protein KXS11_10050 [Plantibacter flavus]|uniref:hypothetical protein n=1 Tax=Plantibacter flavus TaxID=150123 RepID=UPI003F18C6E9
MSTIDPGIAKQLRAARRPSNLRVVVTLLLLFAGGCALGFGWGGFGWMVDLDTEQVDGLVAAAIPVGMALTVISSIAWTFLVARRGDLGIMYGSTAVLLGGALGVFLVSQRVDDRGMLSLVVIGLLVLAAGALILGLVAAAARRRSVTRADDAVRSGRETTATVTDRGWTVFHESDRIFTTVTFSFVDLAGTRRWVQRQMVIHAAHPVENGQETRLWFDPAKPGDDRRIVVELAQQNPLRPLPG